MGRPPARRLLTDPARRGEQPTASNSVSNTLPRSARLLVGEQVEEQRAQTGVVQSVGDEAVPRAQTAAPAAMGEQDQSRAPTGTASCPGKESRPGATTTSPSR